MFQQKQLRKKKDTKTSHLAYHRLMASCVAGGLVRLAGAAARGPAAAGLWDGAGGWLDWMSSLRAAFQFHIWNNTSSIFSTV